MIEASPRLFSGAMLFIRLFHPIKNPGTGYFLFRDFFMRLYLSVQVNVVSCSVQRGCRSSVAGTAAVIKYDRVGRIVRQR